MARTPRKTADRYDTLIDHLEQMTRSRITHTAYQDAAAELAAILEDETETIAHIAHRLAWLVGDLHAKADFFPSFLAALDGSDVDTADADTRWPWSRVFAGDNTAESMAHNLIGYIHDLLDRIQELEQDAIAPDLMIDAIERRDPWQLADAIEAATTYRVPVALIPALIGNAASGG